LSFYPLENIYNILINSSGITLTQREVDIVACLLSGKGTKAIATILFVSPRTVDTHIRNILLKYESYSREEIITAIEKSEAYFLFKDHYLFLLRSSSFQQLLQKIAGAYKNRKIDSIILYGKNLLLEHLADYLRIVGIESTINKKSKWPLSLPETLPIIGIIEKRGANTESSVDFLLLHTANEVTQKIENVEYIEILFDENNPYQEMENFYNKFFIVLKTILPHSTNLDTFIADFQKSTHNFQEHKEINYQQRAHVNKEKKPNCFRTSIFLNRKINFIIFLCIFLAVLSAFFSNTWIHSFSNRTPVRFIISLPHKQYILNRQSLLERIQNTFKRQSCEIKNIVLMGAGGTGKTTIARLYASSQNIPLIWEMNAETKETLLSSFKDLASALSKTSEQKEDLEIIRKILDPHEQEKQLMFLVKKLLKEKSSWLLIYDNVEVLSDIKDLMPDDEKTWGSGRVLMTTRDINTKNTSYISSENVLFIDELDQTEALTLFSQILFEKEFGQLTSLQRQELIPFVQRIPNFPLDISIAAFYIKNTHLTFDQYLERIRKFSEDFDQAQASIYKKVNHYTKTRYGLVITSLEKIVEAHPDFKDLLFLICLFNSQDIPVTFLIHCKGQLTTEKFIYELKKHGLITNEILGNKKNASGAFSIHRSTQDIGLTFLNNVLSKQDIDSFINKVIDSFKGFKELGPNVRSFCDFSENIDCVNRVLLFSHFDAFYKNMNEIKISENIRHKCQAYLLFLNGTTSYCCSSDMILCEKYLSKFFNPHKENDYLQHLPLNMQVMVLLALGTTYIDLSEPDVGLNYLQRSLPLIERLLEADVMKSEALRLIGIAYSRKNEFENSNQFFKRALASLPAENTLRKKTSEAETYLQLASSYSNHFIIKDPEAETYMQKALAILKADHSFFETQEQSLQSLTFTIARQKERLGEIYNRLGRYREAISKGLREADYIMEKGHLFSHHFLKAEIDLNMGEALLREGKLKQALQRLTNSLRISEKILGPTAACSWHAKIYRIEVYLRLGKLKEAYDDCVSISTIDYKKTYPYSDLLYATGLYCAAIIAYRQNDLERSEEFFIEFLKKIKYFCCTFLDAKTFKNLDSEGTFEVMEKHKDLKIYFQSCSKIFISIYGKDHSFVRDFVLTNVIS